MVNQHLIYVSLNARFRRARRISGVQNWSTHVAEALKSIDGITVTEHLPHPFFATGIRGHFWEQFILPVRARKSNILVSPGNSGPIFFKKNLVCVHDAMVFTHPELFNKSYKTISKILLKAYSPNRVRILTVSRSSMDAIRQVVSSAMMISVVGVGLPQFESTSVEDAAQKYFLFIGGDIERKNLKFLLQIWGHIYKSTGFELVVITGEKSSSLSTTELKRTEGVRYIVDPDNLELSNLYRCSRALLWPSIVEGFGIPLLEAMSFGKSFISTPVGAADELQTGESVVLSLDTLSWTKQILHMALNPQTDSADQIFKARNYTWSAVANKIKLEIDSFAP